MASKDFDKPNNGQSKRTKVMNDSVGVKGRVGEGHALDAKSQEAIGRSLKAHYEDLVRAPIPDKFLEMLDRLEATELSKSHGRDDETG
jgi:hypothetical protein